MPKRRPYVPAPSEDPNDFLTSILEAATEFAVIGIDMRGVIVLWSAGAQRLFGYAASQIIGNEDFNTMHLALGVEAKVLNNIVRIATLEPKWDGMLEHKHLDGTPTKTQMSVTKRYDRQGVHVGFLVMARDITRVVEDINRARDLRQQALEVSEQAQKELQATERRNQLLFEHVLDHAILMLDANGNISSWNSSAQKTTGYQQHQAIHRHFRIFATADDVSTFTTESLLKVAREEGVIEEEGWRRRADGVHRWISVTVTSIWESSGLLAGYAVVMRDITEKKTLEDDLRALNADLEHRVAERVRDLNQFTSSVSHDLRAPLMAINAFSQILLRDHAEKLDDGARTYLEGIFNSSERMNALIKDLLTYARLGKTSVKPEPTAIGPIVDDAIKNLSIQIRSTHALISVPKDLPTVVGTTVLLRQVFTNLIENALKYRKPNCMPEIAISWHMSPLPDVVTIAVQDNGIGIESKFFEQIFRVFTRLHHQEAYPGTGIGLSIVQRSVSLMDGGIRVDSVPGKGSCFYVDLKIAGNP